MRSIQLVIVDNALINRFIHSSTLRPLQNGTLCQISALGSNFNPQNTQCIPPVNIFAFLELEHKLPFFKGLTFILETFAQVHQNRLKQ